MEHVVGPKYFIMDKAYLRSSLKYDSIYHNMITLVTVVLDFSYKLY